MIGAMPHSHAGILLDTIVRLADETRRKLGAASVMSAVPFAILRDVVTLDTTLGRLAVRARPLRSLPATTLAITEIDTAESEAWVWMNRDAWPELVTETPRTRATCAHECAHAVLHADVLAELDDHAEPDHDAALDREAWRFAAELLIPDQALRRLSRHRADEIAARFGVTLRLAERRLGEFAAES